MRTAASQRLEAESFDALYRGHVREVYRYSLAVVRDPVEAEDVTQTTFLNALAAFGEHPPRKPRQWLIAIARNVCLDRRRQAGRRPEQVTLHELPALPADEFGVRADELVAAMRGLPARQREALMLDGLEGRSRAQIAAALGVGEPAIAKLLIRARGNLRLQLDEAMTCKRACALAPRIWGKQAAPGERRAALAHLQNCDLCVGVAKPRTLAGLLAAIWPLVRQPSGLRFAPEAGALGKLAAVATGGSFAVKAAVVATVGTLAAGVALHETGRDGGAPQTAVPAAATGDQAIGAAGPGDRREAVAAAPRLAPHGASVAAVQEKPVRSAVEPGQPVGVAAATAGSGVPAANGLEPSPARETESAGSQPAVEVAEHVAGTAAAPVHVAADEPGSLPASPPHPVASEPAPAAAPSPPGRTEGFAAGNSGVAPGQQASGNPNTGGANAPGQAKSPGASAGSPGQTTPPGRAENPGGGQATAPGQQANPGQGTAANARTQPGNLGQGNGARNSAAEKNPAQNNPAQGNPGEGNAGQSSAGQGNAGQGNAGQGNAANAQAQTGNSGQGSTGQSNVAAANPAQSNPAQASPAQTNLPPQGNPGAGNAAQGTGNAATAPGSDNPGGAASGQSAPTRGQAESGEAYGPGNAGARDPGSR